MKKKFILGILFILPIVLYLFFSSGENYFARLPVLTENVKDLEDLTSLDGDIVRLHQHITILGFMGRDVTEDEILAFNLNEKIYKRFFEFEDFQTVMLMPEGLEADARKLRKELSGATATDMKNWKFVFGTEEVIQAVFKSLKTPWHLNEQMGSPYIFIVDKNRHLRGRDDEKEEKLFGYNALSVAEIHNKMVDDVKVILAEYRMARKENNSESRRESYLKKVK